MQSFVSVSQRPDTHFECESCIPQFRPSRRDHLGKGRVPSEPSPERGGISAIPGALGGLGRVTNALGRPAWLLMCGAVSGNADVEGPVAMGHPGISVPVWTRDSGVKPSGGLWSPINRTHAALRNRKLHMLHLFRDLSCGEHSQLSDPSSRVPSQLLGPSEMPFCGLKDSDEGETSLDIFYTHIDFQIQGKVGHPEANPGGEGLSRLMSRTGSPADDNV